MKKIKVILFIPVVMASALIVSSCFLEKIGDNLTTIAAGLTTLIKGSLGGGFSSLADTPAGSNFVDKVWAVPLQGGSGGTWTAGIFEYSLDNYAPQFVEFDIEYDLMGNQNFAVDVDQLKGREVMGQVYNGDWALILVNSQKRVLSYDLSNPAEYAAATAQRRDCLVSYLALSDTSSANNDTLVKMPINEINNLAEINMGTVNKSTDGSEAQSTISLDANADKIAVATEQLKERARMDNVFNHIKNVFVNTRIMPVPVYNWAGKPNAVPAQSAFAKLIQTTGRSLNEIEFSGLNLAFNYSWNEFHTIAAAASTAETLKVKVPGTIDYRYNDKDTGNQVNVTYYKGDYISGDGLINEGVMGPGSYHIMLGYFMSVPPAGWFELMIGDTAYGYFDISLINPFVGTTTEYTIVYMPVLKLTIDSGTRAITGVSVDWYYYKNGGWDIVDTADELQNFYNNTSQVSTAGSGDFLVTFRELGNNDPNAGYKIIFNGNTSTTTITETWYYPQATGDLSLNTHCIENVNIRYMYAGVSFEFYWFQPYPLP